MAADSQSASGIRDEVCSQDSATLVKSAQAQLLVPAEIGPMDVSMVARYSRSTEGVDFVVRPAARCGLDSSANWMGLLVRRGREGYRPCPPMLVKMQHEAHLDRIPSESVVLREGEVAVRLAQEKLARG